MQPYQYITLYSPALCDGHDPLIEFFSPDHNEQWSKLEGEGVDVVTGKEVDMINSGIIDPVLVTKSALKNAVSVVSTIISAACVISNMRMNESDQ